MEAEGAVPTAGAVDGRGDPNRLDDTVVHDATIEVQLFDDDPDDDGHG